MPAQGYQEVVNSASAFNEGLVEGKGLEKKLSYFRSWYYVPELDAVAPSKFIGYKNMTVNDYMTGVGTDGKVTEPLLSQWFDSLKKGSPEADYVECLVKDLLAKHNETLNRKARFNAKRGWRIDEARPISEEMRPETPGGTRPIVTIFWRAFLSLYPEDQDALVKRILEHRRGQEE
jgi:hypothetical protein